MKNEKSGNCYEAAIRLIGTRKNSALLVHGFIYSTKRNQYIKHAWVEDDGYCLDFAEGRRIKMKKETYYKEGKATAINSYNKTEIQKMLDGTRRYDFWTKKEREETKNELDRRRETTR